MAIKLKKYTQLIAEQRAISDTIAEWHSRKKRKGEGCVHAANWFCKRHPEFKPKRLTRYTEDGHPFQHVVAHHKGVVIDLAHEHDKARDA